MAVDITGDVPRLVEPPSRAWTATFPLFAKLGAKSWRDSGSLRIIPEQQPVAQAIECMLSRLSARQERYLTLAKALRTRLELVLFRYADFGEISEARWRVRRGEASLSSGCFRGASAAIARASTGAMKDLAEATAAAVGADAIVDLAMRPCGTLSILEINPDRAALMRGSADALPAPCP
ncbi:hypothetical protein E2493_08830 [Sphingomonas parva]|uniref:ATP-grasp domain-containing protein n=1 Tax=Sphingomonas parva TaxID=2555898 RepID=A0A4Y8ZRU5_9SPHN|nr:hypothetical protein [Sphingomonas parva]TFI58723.1 hypothetical protein E2493_08830 [Sphingomonas parva]